MNKSQKKAILKQIHNGEIESLNNLHKSHPEIHWKDLRYESTGDTILHVAARLGYTNITTFCLENYTPKCVDCRNNDNKTALHEAAQFAQTLTAKILLQHGADVNALKKADWTPLMLACTKIQSESIDIVNLLISHGACINYSNKDGWTALHLICREGDLAILKLLIANGLNINLSTKNGRNALHIATLHGNLNLLNLLLLLDINVKDGCGNTPLHEAVLSNNLSAFNTVLNLGGDLFAVNNSGYTVLHLAASIGALDIIKDVAHRFDINACAVGGVTALHCAARKGERKAFDMLVEYGGDVCLQDVHGRTAVDYMDLL